MGIPNTRSRLESTEPTRLAATTSLRPRWSAETDRISSTLLPKVTLSSAPMAVPKRAARSSVTSPSISASGMRARRFCVQEHDASSLKRPKALPGPLLRPPMLAPTVRVPTDSPQG